MRTWSIMPFKNTPAPILILEGFAGNEIDADDISLLSIAFIYNLTLLDVESLVYATKYEVFDATEEEGHKTVPVPLICVRAYKVFDSRSIST